MARPGSGARGQCFVGGLDFTDVQGNRHDDSAHDKRDAIGWHDVATEVRGLAVTDVAAHFVDRWGAATGRPLSPPEPRPERGHVAMQVLRTVPNGVYDFLPDGDFSILAACVQALSAAREFIYVENQFLWSPEIIDILIDKLEHSPTDSFRVLLVLPRRPDNGNDTTNGQLARLIDADKRGGGGRLLATTLLGPTWESSGVYLHAKVAIIDDAWLTIGSANLNEHSLYNDTEVNVLVLDPDLARRTRLRLWAEHLRMPEADLDGPVAHFIDTIWTAQCDEQDDVSEQERDPVHRVRRLAGLSRRRDRLKGPLLGLVVDG